MLVMVMVLVMLILTSHISHCKRRKINLFACHIHFPVSEDAVFTVWYELAGKTIIKFVSDDSSWLARGGIEVKQFGCFMR